LPLFPGHRERRDKAALARGRYQPTLFNGEPVEVVTQIEVHFSLAE
jgi:hypothetical protein